LSPRRNPPADTTTNIEDGYMGLFVIVCIVELGKLFKPLVDLEEAQKEKEHDEVLGDTKGQWSY